MRAFCIALALFVGLLGGILINSLYVQRVLGEVIALAELTVQGDDPMEGAQALQAFWQDEKGLLDLSVNANLLERMNEYICSLIESIGSEKWQEVEKYRSLIVDLAGDILNYELPSLFGIC